MKLSVALCTYNGEKYIEEQLRSILDQSVGVDEIVICDDSPREDTVQIAERILKDSGIAYEIIVNDPPLGVADNFLKALKHTSGDYVFTCDQDDIWHKDKVEIFRHVVEKTKKSLYFSDGVLVDGAANPMGNTLWQAYAVDRELEAGGPILPMLIRRPMVTGAAMLVSRQLIDSITEIPEQWLHDEWFAMAAAARDDIAPVPELTFDYRQHGANVVGAKRLSFAEKAKNWAELLWQLKPLRKQRLKKTRDALRLTAGTRYDSYVQEAVAFWETLDGLSDLGFGKGIARIIKLYRSGGYRRFYNGFRGAVRDCLSCFFKKRT